MKGKLKGNNSKEKTQENGSERNRKRKETGFVWFTFGIYQHQDDWTLIVSMFVSGTRTWSVRRQRSMKGIALGHPKLVPTSTRPWNRQRPGHHHHAAAPHPRSPPRKTQTVTLKQRHPPRTHPLRPVGDSQYNIQYIRRPTRVRADQFFIKIDSSVYTGTTHYVGEVY